MKKIMKKGFTLIELMVVMAIIAILSTTVLIALSSVRNKGTDTATKSIMTGLMSLMLIHYEDPSTAGVPNTGGQGVYINFCAQTGGWSPSAVTSACSNVTTNTTNKRICQSFEKIIANTSARVCNTEGAPNQKVAVSATLKDGTTWCVDSELTSKGNSTAASGACN